MFCFTTLVKYQFDEIRFPFIVMGPLSYFMNKFITESKMIV